MTSLAFLLLAISAFVHAGWNLVCKRQCPTQLFFFLTSMVGFVLLSPLLLYHWARLAEIPAAVWWRLLATGFFMALYYIALAGAYRVGDLSVIYPLARALPILLITFVSFLLGRGDEIGRLAIVGILLVVTGCFLLPMQRFDGWRLRNYMNAGCALALLAAVGTTGYTVIDDLGVAELRAPPARLFGAMEAAFLYQGLQAFSSMLWQGLGMLLVRDDGSGRDNAAFAHQWKSALIAGIGIYLAYGLALTAMAHVSDVSYVAAFRQLSIPIGAAGGIFLLKEPCYGPRVAGVCTILAGLLLVGLG